MRPSLAGLAPALLAFFCAGTALAAEPVTIRRLVEHYYPYYFKYVGPREATGELPMMTSTQFLSWLQQAGADDDAVRRSLALRNARLEMASAFDFILTPLDSRTRVANMAELLIKLHEAGQRFQLHTGEPPRNLTDLWQDPGLTHWAGPYIQAATIKPFFKRYQQLVMNISLASDVAGTPPPPCPTPSCISWAWLRVDGIPPLYAQQLDIWLDTHPTPTEGQIRLTPDGFMYSLMRTNK